MTDFERNVALPNGSFANMVGESAVIEAMYPVGLSDDSLIYIGEPVTDNNGVLLTPMNSVLRFEQMDGDKTAVLGNTVTRGCAVAEDCGSCALAGAGLSLSEMARKNCARANTSQAFEFTEQEASGRFVLLPTSKNALVVSETNYTPEFNGDELLQNRLKPAMSVVFTDTWMQKNDIDQITVGMNGADGSMGVMTTEISDETLIIPFCSMRGNMGDRGPENQILRQALNSYFDSIDLSDEQRQIAVAKMKPSITLSASASLKNFAHKINVPREDAFATDAERKEGIRLREKYPDLVKLAGDKITSAIILNDQYPGALGRGSIFPQFEAELGIRDTPIGPDTCPGDGQTCHIDYRTETEYALTEQLKDMGVPEANIYYDDSQALDPASPENKMASNRAEQNNGVPVALTSRTLNGMTIRIRK